MMDWNKLITEAHAENSKGIEMRRGKKYTTVAVRVEILRRNFGGVGISTEIVQWSPDKGAPIVVKATVTDETGRVMSTGYAEEIRGQG
jgi:formylmethanofuran dehydrogenase subunit C